MTITLIIIVIMLALFLGWILSQSFNVKPWIAAAPTANMLDRLPVFFTLPRVGLLVFLATITSLFALTISAYSGRMHLSPDWVPVQAPPMLWLNTALLVLGSISLHRGWQAAVANDERGLKRGLTMGGAFAIAFIVGQYLVWKQLHAGGYHLAANPANSFFYLVTGLHAAHLLGGLVAWVRTMRKAWMAEEPVQVRTSMELCTVYWHYLLVMWAVLFGLVLFT